MSRDEIFRVLAEYILRKAAQELVKQDESTSDQTEKLRDLARRALGVLDEVLDNIWVLVTTQDSAYILADAADIFQNTLGMGDVYAYADDLRREADEIDYEGAIRSHYDVEENMKSAALEFIKKFKKDISEVETEIESADEERLKKICEAVYETLGKLAEIGMDLREFTEDIWDDLESVVSKEVRMEKEEVEHRLRKVRGARRRRVADLDEVALDLALAVIGKSKN